MTVKSALEAAQRAGVDKLDARWLLAHVTGRSRAWLLAHDDDALPAEHRQSFEALVERRAAGEPFAYLVGEREFHGLVLRVSPAVLVPRPDTETLVDWALTLLDGGAIGGVAAPRVIDLGTGSGAIALAVKHRCARARVQALDVSIEALAVARDNAARLTLDVAFLQSDWWQAVEGDRFDLALSNPPYIADADPHLAALRHEPDVALTSGPDGLDAIRRIVADAPRHLTPDGWLLVEHGHDQGAAVRSLLTDRGFSDVSTHTDIEQRERCSGGRCCAATPNRRPD